VNFYFFPDPAIHSIRGITGRDYFAAQAMVALIPMLTSEKSDSEHLDFEYECISNEAYALADAMLKARIPS
jgi:hypothetical protein